MKKILPIIALLGAGSFVALNSNQIQNKKNTFVNNIDAFKEDLADYTSLNEKQLTKTVFNKYNLALLSDDADLLDDTHASALETADYKTSNEEIQPDNNQNDNIEEINNITQENEENSYNIDSETEQTSETEKHEDFENDETSTKISTLYSLSNDIEDSCDDFCELRQDITAAIIETQSLINKIKNNELELTDEQRLMIVEQSSQLKGLGRKLANITTELSFHLSDLNQIMNANSKDIDTLNMKYLIVLDNLVNGNEMLQTSLNSINLINQMFNAKSTLPPNNQGRILYGFQHNNNDPIIKGYYINENGEMVENSQETHDSEAITDNGNTEVEESSKKNIDTYQNRALETNIDTYQNTNIPRNIDSFFNTALLDNEFMYGNRGYGYGAMNGMYGYQNPHMQNYANYENRNTSYSGNYSENPQKQGQANNATNRENQTKQEKKRIRLKKNIDTYKDENEPDIKTKLGNIKNSITSFFGNFKSNDLHVDLDNKIDNPIYRFDAKK